MDESSYYGDENPIIALEQTIRFEIATIELDLANIQSVELRAFGNSLLQQKRLDLLELYTKFGNMGAEQSEQG